MFSLSWYNITTNRSMAKIITTGRLEAIIHQNFPRTGHSGSVGGDFLNEEMHVTSTLTTNGTRWHRERKGEGETDFLVF